MTKIIPWNATLALSEPELRLADSRVPLRDCCTEPGAPVCRFEAACHCDLGYCDCEER